MSHNVADETKWMGRIILMTVITLGAVFAGPFMADAFKKAVDEYKQKNTPTVVVKTPEDIRQERLAYLSQYHSAEGLMEIANTTKRDFAAIDSLNFLNDEAKKTFKDQFELINYSYRYPESRVHYKQLWLAEKFRENLSSANYDDMVEKLNVKKASFEEKEQIAASRPLATDAEIDALPYLSDEYKREIKRVFQKADSKKRSQYSSDIHMSKHFFIEANYLGIVGDADEFRFRKEEIMQLLHILPLVSKKNLQSLAPNHENQKLASSEVKARQASMFRFV